MPAGTSVATLSGQWPAESTHYDLMVFRVRGWQELADGEPDPRA